jgi:hypothetical protein
MAARVNRPLKVIAFNANGIWRQRYELSKQLQDLYIYIYIYGSALRHISNHMRGSSFQITTFVLLIASWEEKEFPITMST